MTTSDIFDESDLFVSPDGDDEWSGEYDEPTDEGDDGPLRTIEGAREAVRERRENARLSGEPTVWVRGGRYERTEPLVFCPGDGPVCFAAYPGEEPVVSGGTELDGWTEVEIDGVEAWKTTVPAVRDGKWYFRSLFVNGERARRSRLPKVRPEEEELTEDDFHRFADVPAGSPDDWIFESSGTRTIEYAEGDVDPEWHNVTDVDMVVLHYWIEERLPIAEVDPERNRVKSSRQSAFSLTSSDDEDWARYYVENVFEALSEPGEFYLDRETGECYYVPRVDEDPEDATVVAPRATRLVCFEGDPETDDHVEHVSLEGITLAHTDWTHPGHMEGRYDDDEEWAAAVQAAFNVDGAVSMRGARYCGLEDCAVTHVGGYGIRIDEGCRGIRVVGNEIGDLAAGGVSLLGGTEDDPRGLRTGRIRITDNHVHDGGAVYHSGVGVLARNVFDTEIAHNHVHDFYYTGVSCGWEWGYAECVERDNRIAHNHIHDLGKRLLSDMGGIYTLGVQPGTVIRGNHIHDVDAWAYGGWGIYPDEGSSHLVIEDNVAYDTNKQAFNQHYGRENLVRNNVFGFGAESQTSLGRAEDHVSYTFERNVVVTDGVPLFRGGYGWDVQNEDQHHAVSSDLNLFWDVSDAPLTCGEPTEEERRTAGPMSFEEWTEAGRDAHSVVADPQFADVDGRDLTVSPDSPATELGFEPFEIEAGPRPPEKR